MTCKKPLILTFLVSLFFTVVDVGCARSEILMESSGLNSPLERVSFSLSDDDIVAWEESGEGKYIYFTLSDEKNGELADITAKYLGHPMRLVLKETFILIPEITNVLEQNFVLQIGEGRSIEMLRLLGREKKKETKSEISIGAKPESLKE